MGKSNKKNLLKGLGVTGIYKAKTDVSTINSKNKSLLYET